MSVWLLLGGYVALVITYFIWTWSHILGDFGGDNAYYLLTARYFSPYLPSSDVASFFVSHSPYPPLFPLFLALTGGAENLLAAHVVTTISLLLALAILYVWARTLDLPVLIAGMAVLFFAILPGTYTHALSILSENFYLMWCLLAITSVSLSEKNGDMRWLWVASVAVAATTLTRSAGISLLAAFVIYLALNKPRPHIWWHVALAAIPFLLWSLVRPSGTGYLRIMMDKYDVSSFTGIMGAVYSQLGFMLAGWIGNFSGSPVLNVVIYLIGVLSLVGMGYRCAKQKFDGIYAFAYLVLVMIWPFPAETKRLILVIVPVLLIHALLVIRNIGLLGAPPRLVQGAWALFLASLAIVVLPNLVLTSKRFFQPLPEDLEAYRRSPGWYSLVLSDAHAQINFEHAFTEGLKRIAKHVPENACVYSIKPTLVGYFLNRRAYAPPKQELDDPAFYSVLETQGCRYFLLSGFVSPSYNTPYYPAARLHDNLTPLETIIASGEVVPVAVLAEWSGEIPAQWRRSGDIAGH